MIIQGNELKGRPAPPGLLLGKDHARLLALGKFSDQVWLKVDGDFKSAGLRMVRPHW
jgi:hypothetical protein